MDSSDITTANGLPCAFEQYEIFQEGEWSLKLNFVDMYNQCKRKYQL